ncbi:MAG: peptide chain release factor N(5)-glutamine methyltransferase [Bacteroidetes bacterium]|nr:peptide chain release factor N(5)-glutamine methyltransferase [Bacteroidota bacterium]
MSSEITPLLLQALEDSMRRGIEAGIDVSKREWEWMMESATGATRIQWMIGSVEEIPTRWLDTFHDMVERRLCGEPLQYILGVGAFYGRDFEVGPSVLIPRPETELIVEWALSNTGKSAAPRILDIGTGSGCLAVTLALERPNSQVSALDISEEALVLAAKNAVRLGATVHFEALNILTDTISGGPFDLIISNPPYVPLSERATLQREVVQYEPHLALFAGEDPLIFYRRIAAISPGLLAPGGLVCVEIHSNYGLEVSQIFEGHGFFQVSIQKDLSKLDRFVVASVD